jgi:hypothetical protein
MKSTVLVFIGIMSGLAHTAWAEPIPPGTEVAVRNDITIDVRDADGRVFPGFVARDVAAPDGRIVIPRGSRAELIVRRLGPRDFAVDLASVTVHGRRYSIDTSDAEHVHNHGEGRRTGAFAGGGAIVGTLLGAIAGGGKGAAIGALAGGAAGAGTAIATRGERVHIPAESVLTFRVEQPLDIYPDRGYERDGNHYHRDWDYRNEGQPPPPRQ